MIKKGFSLAILVGAVTAFGPPRKNRVETTANVTAEEAPISTADSGAKSAEQTAVVAPSIMSDSKMAVDYNGYYYGSSGNVEEY